MINATSGNAIPWNGSNAAILQSALGLAYPLNFADEYGTYFSADYGNFLVLTPDNLIISGANAATYAAAQQTTLPPLPPGVAPIQNSEGSGAVRRLATVSSSTMVKNPYTGVGGVFYLPPYTNDFNFVMQPVITGVAEDKAVMGAHAYVGIIGEANGNGTSSPTIDAGVIFAPAGKFKPYDSNTVGKYLNRWSPTIRINDGREKLPPRNGGYPTTDDPIGVTPLTSATWLDAGSQSGVTVAVTVQLVDNQKACKILIVGGDGKQVIDIPILAPEKFASRATSSPGTGHFDQLRSHALNYRMKRVISIDQKPEYPNSSLFKPSYTGILFTMPYYGMFRGAYQDGTSLQGVAHRGYLMKLNETTWTRWDKNHDTDVAHGMDFKSQWITKPATGKPVSTGNYISTLMDEVVNIVLSP